MAQGKAWDKEKILESLKPFLTLGYSLNKACVLAEIEYTTVQKWLQKDNELSVKVKSWQNMPSAKARQNVVKAIKGGDNETSKWWLERREKKAFSTKQVIEQEGEVVATLNFDTEQHLKDLLKKTKSESK